MPTINLNTQQHLAALWLSANWWLCRANDFDRKWSDAGARDQARQWARERLDAYFAANEEQVVVRAEPARR
jgi:hypothetical protein